MKQFIEKMKIELKDLQGKIKRTEQAVETPPYGADKTSIDLLKAQIKYMQGYASFLEQRIEYEGGRL
jgi:hypothetical protein